MPASVERWRQFAAVVLTMIALICSTVVPTSWTPAAFGAHKDRSEAVRPQFGPGTSNNEGYGPLNDPPNLKPDSKAATHAEHPGVIEVTERARHRGLSGTHNVPPGKPGQLDAETLIARLPVHFVENRGQSHGAVRFEVKAQRHKVFFTSNEVVFAAVSEIAGKRTAEAIRLKFLGASANPVISGTEMLPGKFNYFIGNDPSKWKTDVPSFRGVAYNGLYKGVDLVFKDNHGQIERDFVIGPRVDPDVIRMRYQGAKNVRLSKDGELLVETLSSVLAESRPQAYQNIAGKRVEVAATFKICKDGSVGISVGRYDCSQQLIIDPIFRFSTFVGGSENDQALGLAVDATGVYAAGITTSLDFPSTGIFGPPGGFHEFALKLTPDGSSLIYSDVIGGSSDDFGFACQVHPSDGSLYFLGITNSSDFPTTVGAFDTSYNGAQDYNLTRINAAGNAFVWSTYVGGDGQEFGSGGVDVYNNGDCWIVGGTTSLGPSQSANPYPVAQTFGTNLSPTNSGFFDGVATAIRFDGASVVTSGFWGGFDTDVGTGIAINRSNLDFHYSGLTFSSNAPVCTGVGVPFTACQAAGFDTTYNSGRDGHVTRFTNVGTPIGSTFLGDPVTPAADDRTFAIAFDAATPPNVYVVGATDGPGYPTTPGAFDTTHNGEFDQVVTKFNPTLSALGYSTFVGGSGGEEGFGISINSAGSAYITGFTGSSDFPVTNSAPYAGLGDATITKLNPAGSGLLLSELIGGPGFDLANAIRLNLTGNGATIAGLTSSFNFPTTAGAFDTSYNGGLFDAFVSQLDEEFDLCIQAPNRTVLVNVSTGAFKYCGPGGPLSGTGTVSTNGCTITIASAKATITIDSCARTGRARLSLSSGPLLMLDPNIDNNTCLCP